MFGFGKKKKKEQQQQAALEEQQSTVQATDIEESVTSEPVTAPEEPLPAPAAEPAPVTIKDDTQEKPVKKQSWLSRVRAGLGRTRDSFTGGLANLLLGKKTIDDELLEEIETLLLMADVGIEATQQIIQSLTAKVSRKELADSEALYQALQQEMAQMLKPVDQPLAIPQQDGPFVILVVGVNGVGKTTTIGKLARKYQNEGKSVMLAAGDTFRAAAVEQLQVWGERNKVPVVAQHTGADSASVIYDAVESAKSRNADILIADTAGRLHNKDNLMGELEKVVRVMKKLDAHAPHEVLLVLDAATGQNALSQAKTFADSVNVSGLALTKLDGTAKGGIIFALAQQLGISIRFIGVGEQAEDLRDFDADTFIQALFTPDEHNA